MAIPTLPTGATTTPPLPSGALSFDNLDNKTGAPKKIRAAISAYKKPEDKLQLLKKYYPDAIPFGADNYVFTNPKTKQPTLFNPGGFDLGDVAQYGRIAAELIGSGIGMAKGALATSPTIVGVPVGIAAGGAGGSVIAGEIYDSALRYFFGEGAEDTRSFSEYTEDMALQATIEGLTPFPVQKGTQILREGANKVFNNPTAKAAYKSAENLGMKDLPLGVTTGPKIARTENALATTAGGSKIAQSYNDALNQLNKAIEDLTSQGSNLSQQAAGDLILDAALKFEEDFLTRSDFLYKRLNKMIPRNEVFGLNNTQKVLKANEKRFSNEGLREIMGKNLSDKLSVYFSGKPELTYQDLANLRTVIGRQLKGSFVVGTSPDLSDLKKLYSALSDDMFDIAQSIGGDVAQTAKLANNYYKQGSEVINKQIRPITTQSGKDYLPSEKIYNKLESNLKTQPSQANQFLNNLFSKNLANENQLKLLGEKQLYDLTRNVDGGFTPNKTVTNIEKLKKGTGELPVSIQALGTKVDDIETLSRGFKEAGKSVNFSNTAFGNAQREFFTALGIGVGGGILSGDTTTGLGFAVSAYLTPRIFVEALTNPATKASFKNWATKSGVPIEAKTAVLTSIGLTGPQAQSLIEDQYKEQSLLTTQE
tara:strand:- start:226 stop:2172 length:1947 start_codon:yes stop_codon:yes gene_type:complete